MPLLDSRRHCDVCNVVSVGSLMVLIQKVLNLLHYMLVQLQDTSYCRWQQSSLPLLE
jgi:hypothetical protein